MSTTPEVILDPEKQYEIVDGQPEEKEMRGAKHGGVGVRLIADFNKAIAVDPRYTAGYNGRGSTRLEKGLLNEAISDFNKALELDPNYSLSYINRGIALMLQGKKAEANRDFERCLKLDANLKSLTERRISALKQRLRAKW